MAENNPKTLNALRGKRLYKIGSCGTWLYGGFIAAIGDGSGLGSSVVSISYRLMGTAGNVTYSRTGTSTLGISIYKKVENNILSVYLYSTIGNDSFNPICGLSSSSIELLGEMTDLSSYELVASL